MMVDMTFEREKVAPWERYTDGEWHEIRRGPEGEGREESLRHFRRHWESLRRWTDGKNMHGRLSRSENGRIIRVQIRPVVRPDLAGKLKDRTRGDLGRALIQSVQILEYALRLRQFGERAPGGDETWAQFDRDAEIFLRKLRGEQV